MGLFKKAKTKQEITFMERQVPGLTKQVNESLNLVDSTIKPDVYFSRYDFLLETLERLSEIAKHVKITGGKPSDLLKKLSSRKVREESVNNFIKRSHDKMMADATTLKTDKSRSTKVSKYFDEMGKYTKNMYPSNITLLKDLKG